MKSGALAAAAAMLPTAGYTDGVGRNAARPEQCITHRRARLTSGIGAPSHGVQASPDPEKAAMRREARALGMTGKQYRAYLKKLNRPLGEQSQRLLQLTREAVDACT